MEITTTGASSETGTRWKRVAGSAHFCHQRAHFSQVSVVFNVKLRIDLLKMC
jgi:hypothetical protein